MQRSERLKKPHLKYSDKEYVLESSFKKSQAEKSRSIDEDTTKNDVVDGSKRRSTKGNLKIDWKTVKAIRIPVLRDRTNLPKEPLKVDLLMKQGTSDEKQPTKSARRTVKSTTRKANDDERLKKTSSNVGTRKKSAKPETSKKSSLVEDSKEIAKSSEDKITRRKVDRPRMRDTSKDIAKKSTNVTKRRIKLTSLTGNNDKNVETTERKIHEKIEAENESFCDSVDNSEDSDSKDKLENSEIIANSVKIVIKNDSTRKSKKISRVDNREKSVKMVNSSIVKRKFFPSKASAKKASPKSSPVKRTVNAKRRNIGTRKNPRASPLFEPRQLTLEESVAKQLTKKMLRPRRSVKNYCEESIVAEKLDKTKNETNDKDKKILPVYKTIKFDDNSKNDKNKVYEFQFDSNDSTEKLPKKRRKRIVGKNVAAKKIKATISRGKKVTSSRIETIGETANPDIITEEEKIYKPNKKYTSTDSNRQMITQDLRNDETSQDFTENRSNKKSKPTIVDSVELRGNERINLHATPLNTKSNRAHPINNSRTPVQYGAMLNHELLNKSISPINKAIESFDPGSPWRPPTFNTQQFSRIRNIVQSTPHVNKYFPILENNEKSSMTMQSTINDDTRNNQISKINNDDNKVSKNVLKQSCDKVFELAKSPRKFGTEISNVDNSKKFETTIVESEMENSREISENLLKRSSDKAFGLVKSPRKFGTVISNVDNSNKFETTNIDSEMENPRENKILIDKNDPAMMETSTTITKDNTISNDLSETMNFDDYVDKENFHPGLKKSPLKNSNKSLLKNSNVSPLKNSNKSLFKNLNTTPLKNSNKSLFKNSNISPLTTLNKSPLINSNKLALKSNNVLSLKNSNDCHKSSNKFVSTFDYKKNTNNENIEPQAGPSKMESSIDDSRLLQQSNLDNFLNLDEMPKSTTIKTIHGIFDDAHSTPISGKSMKNRKIQPNINNAFGFDDNDDSDINVSPIKIADHQKITTTPINDKRNLKKGLDVSLPARFSIGDIRKHLKPIKKQMKIIQEPIMERTEEKEEEKENRDNREKFKLVKNKKIDDSTSFIDTFDVLSKSVDSNDTTIKEIPLFTDPEPERFKQAPKYSYKRKRLIGFIPSDDEDENDDPSVTINHGTKKRKISKVEKKREKELENWAKDLNQTFEEIEHFDLVVE